MRDGSVHPQLQPSCPLTAHNSSEAGDSFSTSWHLAKGGAKLAPLILLLSYLEPSSAQDKEGTWGWGDTSSDGWMEVDADYFPNGSLNSKWDQSVPDLGILSPSPLYDVGALKAWAHRSCSNRTKQRWESSGNQVDTHRAPQVCDWDRNREGPGEHSERGRK